MGKTIRKTILKEFGTIVNLEKAAIRSEFIYESADLAIMERPEGKPRSQLMLGGITIHVKK